MKRLALGLLVLAVGQGDGQMATAAKSNQGPAVRRFYEVRVPAGRPASELIEAGIGLFPSSAAHAPSDGAWYVALLDEHALQLLRKRGLEPSPAPREALRLEELRAFANAGAAPAGPDAPVPGCDDIPETFCQYTGDNGPCPRSIEAELRDLADDNEGFTRFVDVGDPVTAEGRHLYGIRIGQRTGKDVPQVLLFGAQHAREWATSGLLVHLARRLVAAYNDPAPANDWLRQRLATRAVLIVPVANPDGYAFTFTDAVGSRDWRKNRAPCTEEPALGACGPGNTCPARQTCVATALRSQCYEAGVDLNRNFPFDWRNTGDGCSSERYEGPAAASEPETAMLNRLLLHDGLAGSYVTRFFVNYHSYGNYVLYPDGITDGDDGELHDPCRTGALVPENCQPPEFDVLRWIAGSEASPRLRDELSGQPYKTDTVYRSLYATVGDQISHHTYSPSIEAFDQPRDRRSLGIGLEVTGSSVGFHAECMTLPTWNALVDNHYGFVRRLLDNLTTLSSSSGLASVTELRGRTGRRIHRLRGNDDTVPATYGPPRLYLDQLKTLPAVTIQPPEGFAPGSTQDWDTAGLFYRTIRWSPETPYVFPPRLTVCPLTPGACETVDLDGGVNLCSAGLFDLAAGWAFTPSNNAPGEDDCYWSLTGRGAGPFELRRLPRNMVQADLVHLDYSYRIDPDAFEAAGRVEVSVQRAGGAWQVVRVYPAGRVGGHTSSWPDDEDAGTSRLRTEHVDLPAEFDFANGIRVRFVATGVKAAIPSAFAFRVYDVVMVGRHVD
jgi:zinc carboxypeptidase